MMMYSRTQIISSWRHEHVHHQRSHPSYNTLIKNLPVVGNVQKIPVLSDRELWLEIDRSVCHTKWIQGMNEKSMSSIWLEVFVYLVLAQRQHGRGILSSGSRINMYACNLFHSFVGHNLIMHGFHACADWVSVERRITQNPWVCGWRRSHEQPLPKHVLSCSRIQWPCYDRRRYAGVWFEHRS